MPSLTGTLVHDAHDLDSLAGLALGNLPFGAFYIAGIPIGIPVSDIEPAPPGDRIHGTAWSPVRGRGWTRITGTPWTPVRRA